METNRETQSSTGVTGAGGCTTGGGGLHNEVPEAKPIGTDSAQSKKKKKKKKKWYVWWNNEGEGHAQMLCDGREHTAAGRGGGGKSTCVLGAGDDPLIVT